MTLPRYDKLQEYWRDVPPVDWSVAAYLGILKKKPEEGSGDDLKADILKMGGTVVG